VLKNYCSSYQKAQVISGVKERSSRGRLGLGYNCNYMENCLLELSWPLKRLETRDIDPNIVSDVQNESYAL